MIITKSVTCAEAMVRCAYGVYCCDECMTVIAVLVDEKDTLEAIEKRIEAEDKAYADWLTAELAKDVKEVSFEDLLNKPSNINNGLQAKYDGTHDLELAQMEAAMVSNLRYV
jgi:hypothetical protein